MYTLWYVKKKEAKVQRRRWTWTLINEDEELNKTVECDSASFPAMYRFDEEDDYIGKEEWSWCIVVKCI